MTGVMNGRVGLGETHQADHQVQQQESGSQHEAFPIGPPEDGPGDADAEHEGDGFSLPWEQFFIQSCERTVWRSCVCSRTSVTSSPDGIVRSG